MTGAAYESEFDRLSDELSSAIGEVKNELTEWRARRDAAEAERVAVVMRAEAAERALKEQQACCDHLRVELAALRAPVGAAEAWGRALVDILGSGYISESRARDVAAEFLARY